MLAFWIFVAVALGAVVALTIWDQWCTYKDRKHRDEQAKKYEHINRHLH